MPSFSATNRAPAAAGITPVATSASHPSAVAVTASNWLAINSAACRGRFADDGGGAPVVSARADWPKGTIGTPMPASRCAKSSSGGAHTRTSAPSTRNRAASPTSGSTSPRDPYVDNNTRTSRFPFPQVLASAGDSAALPGSCRKSPSALYVESGRELGTLLSPALRATPARFPAIPRSAVATTAVPASPPPSRPILVAARAGAVN